MADLTIIYQRHWQRRGTAADLAARNEVLYAGEFCYEEGTGKLKIGDGETPFNDLPYIVDERFAVAGGTANALTATIAQAAVLYDGLVIRIRATLANTANNPTLSLNGNAALTITKAGGQLLAASDIAANQAIQLLYRAATTTWQLMNPSGLRPVQVLTDAATIAIDASLGDNFRVVLGGNRTLGNPTNLTDGQTFNIRIKQDATGSRTLAYGTKWKFPLGAVPTLTTAANAVDFLSAQYDASVDTIFAVVNKAFA